MFRANSHVQTPPINLKERIAAIEQLNASPKSRSESPNPSGIPQLATNNALRDKIAKFERKGGVPVPRGRFGLGAPPADSGKPRKHGEMYGNRIPRAVSRGVPTTVGSQASRRSMSLSVQFDYDSSSSFGSRSTSPCPSDYDGMSDGVLSPDSSKMNFDQTEDPTSPVHELASAPLSPRSEASSELEIPHDTSEAVPQVVVTLLSPGQEDALTGKVYPSRRKFINVIVVHVPEVITTLHQSDDGEGNQFTNSIVTSPTLEKQEDERDFIDISREEDSQPLDAAISSPKLEQSPPSDVEILSPKPSGESQPSSATIRSPKPEGGSPPHSAAIPSPKDIQLPNSATLPSPFLLAQPFSDLASSPEHEQSPSTTFPSSVPKGALPFSPTLSSPGFTSASPFSATFPSPGPKVLSPTSPIRSPKLEEGFRPLSPTLSSPGFSNASPFSATFPSPGPKVLSPTSPIRSPNLEQGVRPLSSAIPLSISVATPSPKLEEGVPSHSPAIPLPIGVTIPSPKVEDIQQLSAVTSSPRSAKSDDLFSPTISSPKSEVAQATLPSPKPDQEIQLSDAVVHSLPSPGVKEMVQSPRDDGVKEDEKRQSISVTIPFSPGVGDASQLVNDKVTQSIETQDTETPSISRSSSLRTLTPTSHDPPSIIIADEELTTRPNIPVISLSPPATESITLPSVFTPREILSQESERIVSPISAGIFSPSTPVTPASPNLRSPGETRSRTVSPVESTGSNSSGARPAIWRHSSADERLSNVTSPVSGSSEGTFVRSPHSADALHDPSLADELSEQILQMFLPQESTLGPGVTVTSPSQTGDSPFAQLAYDSPDRRATMPSPLYFSQAGLAMTDMLSPSASSDVVSPPLSSGVLSPGEVVTAQRVATATVRGVPVFLPRREVDYSHFPPTPGVRNTDFGGSLPSGALSPTSPSSRFKNPPSGFPGRSNTFHAVVHGKVRDPASAMPSFGSFLGAPGTSDKSKARQSILNPSNGELATLLQDAALLEHALTQGALIDDSQASEDISESTESGRRSEEQDTEKEDQRRLRRHGTLIQKEGDSFKTSSFRLAMRKKTKHWKASSGIIASKDDLESRPSLEAERLAGLSIPDPAFLQRDPTVLNREKNLPKTPEEFSDSLPKSARPRIISGIKKLAGTGSTRSLQAYPRHSASTSSEQSSEDSMPVATPPDPSNDYSGHDSNLGRGSSNVAWPSSSPKRSGIRRAASFAEKIWNRARTRSASSTLSANDSKGEVLSNLD